MDTGTHTELAQKIRTLAAALYPDIQALRRDLHRHPELSGEEVRTTALVTDVLQACGIAIQPAILPTGVIALIEGGNKKTGSPLIALRADIDALPLDEENTHDFCSSEPGCMHACGHDMHTAMLLGAARMIAELRDQLEGDVLLIFQPSEEKAPGGAQPLLDAGLFERFKPIAIFGQHCFPSVESGSVALCEGSFMAATDELYLTVNGRGGHASAPHKTADPIVASAHIITAIQQLISRAVSPMDPAVISISSIHAGHAPNIIPRQATMSGTMRTMNESVRTLLRDRLHTTVTHVATGLGVDAELEIRKGYPSLNNDPAITRAAAALCREYLGSDKVQQCDPVMTAEDFACYLRVCPGTFWQIGIGKPTQDPGNMLHSPTFDPDEAALETGSGLLAYTAIRFLQQQAVAQ